MDEGRFAPVRKSEGVFADADGWVTVDWKATGEELGEVGDRSMCRIGLRGTK